MTPPKDIGVLGAGVVGLAIGLTLQHAGYRVTLFDKGEPGRGTSYGNAGIFADYARIPYASFAHLIELPRLLLDAQSPLSVRRSHVGKMIPYGYWFARATLPKKYRLGGDVLSALSEVAQQSDAALWTLARANDLVGDDGCLALFGSTGSLQHALATSIKERQDRGADLELLDKEQIRQLEPGLLPFYSGGVRYNRTRYAKNPYALSRRYFEKFTELGGRYRNLQADGIVPTATGASINFGGERESFDAIILAAGFASRQLAKELGCALPLVSERGYHLTLDAAGSQIQRPVVWVDTSVFLTPMTEGIRVAGTAEFADPEDTPSPARSALMLDIARRMLGPQVGKRDEWVGSRPSTPDTLPVIGCSPRSPKIIFAFGHGHLGLSHSSATAVLVQQLLEGGLKNPVFAALNPARFGLAGSAA